MQYEVSAGHEYGVCSKRNDRPHISHHNITIADSLENVVSYVEQQHWIEDQEFNYVQIGHRESNNVFISDKLWKK